MGKLRLVIADSDELERARLKHVLHGISGIEIVGEAADLGSAVATVENSLPDLVIIGDELPQGKDFVICSMRSLFPSVRVIEMSAFRAVLSKTGEQRAAGHLDEDALGLILNTD